MDEEKDALSPGSEKQAYEAPDLELLRSTLLALVKLSGPMCPPPAIRGTVTSVAHEVIVEQVPKVLAELELVKRDLDEALREMAFTEYREQRTNPVLVKLRMHWEARLHAEVEMEANRG